MSQITVEHGYFDDIEEARREIRETGLYHGENEFDLPASGGTPIHWHDVSQTVYITEGLFRFTDPATGETHDCGPGSKIVIPERTLHIEEAHPNYKGVVGINKPDFPEPYVRSLEELENE